MRGSRQQQLRQQGGGQAGTAWVTPSGWHGSSVWHTRLNHMSYKHSSRLSLCESAIRSQPPASQQQQLAESEHAPSYPCTTPPTPIAPPPVHPHTLLGEVEGAAPPPNSSLNCGSANMSSPDRALATRLRSSPNSECSSSCWARCATSALLGSAGAVWREGGGEEGGREARVCEWEFEVWGLKAAADACSRPSSLSLKQPGHPTATQERASSIACVAAGQPAFGCQHQPTTQQ